MGELVAPAEEGDVVEGLGPEEGEVIEIQDEEVEPLKIAPSPVRPSQADVAEHRVTHCPYRSWCDECVEGRGLGEQRGRHAGRAHEIPLVGLDYFYITEHGLQARSELTFGENDEGNALLTEARKKGDVVKCLVIRCFSRRKMSSRMSYPARETTKTSSWPTWPLQI